MRLSAAAQRLRTGWRRAALIALALLFGWEFAAWGAASWLIVREDLPGRADAIMVLSGSAAYAERAQHGALLYRAGRAPRIVLTNDGLRGGWSQSEQRNPFFVERAAAELRQAFVPGEAVEVLPGHVNSTYDEALALRTEAQRRGWKSLLVVTSGYHARRARWTFRRVFEESDGIAVGLDPAAPNEQTPSPLFWWLQPEGWQMVAGEYVKLIYYRWHYR